MSNAQDSAVADGDALRRPRRPRGVHDVDRCLPADAAAGEGRHAPTTDIVDHQYGHALGCDLVRLEAAHCAGEHHARTRVHHHHGKPFRRERRAQRDVDSASLQRAKDGRHHVEPSVQQQGHAVPRPDTVSDQGVRHLVGSRVEHSVGEPLCAVDQSRVVGPRGHALLEEVNDAHGRLRPCRACTPACQELGLVRGQQVQSGQLRLLLRRDERTQQLLETFDVTHDGGLVEEGRRVLPVEVKTVGRLTRRDGDVVLGCPIVEGHPGGPVVEIQTHVDVLVGVTDIEQRPSSGVTGHAQCRDEPLQGQRLVGEGIQYRGAHSGSEIADRPPMIAGQTDRERVHEHADVLVVTDIGPPHHRGADDKIVLPAGP